MQTNSRRKDNACNAMVYKETTRKERVECVKQEEWWQWEARRGESWCTRAATSHCCSFMAVSCCKREVRRRDALSTVGRKLPCWREGRNL